MKAHCQHCKVEFEKRFAIVVNGEPYCGRECAEAEHPTINKDIEPLPKEGE